MPVGLELVRSSLTEARSPKRQHDTLRMNFQNTCWLPLEDSILELEVYVWLVSTDLGQQAAYNVAASMII